MFSKIYQGLCDYGFNVCYFQPKKMLINDLIEVDHAINNIKLIIEMICNNYIDQALAVFLKRCRGKTYVNIVPKINYEVEYGYGSIAQEGNTRITFNQNLSNTKLIAAISDGMGKVRGQSGKFLDAETC